MRASSDSYSTFLGITSSTGPPDHYVLLGIRRFERDPQAIREGAARQAARVRKQEASSNSAEADRLLKEIATAKICLLSADARDAYDAWLRQQVARPISRPSVELAPTPPVLLDPTPLSSSRRRTPLSAWRSRIAVAAVLGAVLILGLIFLRSLVPTPLEVAAHESPTPSKQPDRSGANERSNEATDENPDDASRPGGEPTDDEADASESNSPDADAESAAAKDSDDDDSAQPDEPLDRMSVLRQVAPAIVTLTATGPRGSSVALGIAVADQGLIVTCCDAIDGATEAQVTLNDGTEVAVRGVRQVARDRGLALLQLADGVDSLAPLPYASHPATSGQDVYVLRSDPLSRLVAAPASVLGVVTGGDLNSQCTTVRFHASLPCLSLSTPINHSDRGAPVVDVHGRLLGMAIVPGDVALAEHLAVSVDEIEQFASRHAAKPVVSLAELHESRKAARNVQPIKLASGRVVSARDFELQADAVDRMFPRPTPGDDHHSLPFTMQTAHSQGMHGQRDGKLYGWSVTLDENDNPILVAHYDENARDGPLRLYNRDNSLVLYAEYSRGKKDGVVCLLQEGVPNLVQEWRRGVLEQSHLVRFEGDTPRITTYPGRIQPASEGDLAEAFAWLQKYEDQVQALELPVLPALSRWYKDQEEEVRRERARQLAPAKRAAVQQKLQQQWEANMQFNRSVRRLLLPR